MYIVPRPRLVRLLDQGLQQPLTLVSAAPGFGKTILLATWIHGRAQGDDLKIGWLSLDETDNKPDTFWRYFVAAIRSVCPQASEIARAMLAAERSALNTLQHLSGVATMTRRYVDAIEGTGAILLDTRKTIPGLRLLEKYAARMGGAENHRMRMDDGLLIKDNHVGVCGGVAEAVRAAKAYDSGLKIQVEVDRIAQIEPALEAGAQRLLLDNMKPDTLQEAVALVAGRVPLEASGGVNLDTIRGIAETGVDYISVGRITQSAPAVDIGLDYVLSALLIFSAPSGHLRPIGAANDMWRGNCSKG